MPLSIYAIPNHLATCEKAFLVHSKHTGTIDYESLADRIAEGRTTITKPDALAVIQLLMMEMEKLLADGFVVKLPFGSFYMVASGTLDQQDQAFLYGDKAYGHDLRLHFIPERNREKIIASHTTVGRVPIFDRQAPVMLSDESVRTEEPGRVARGDFLRIHGQRLKFDKAVDELGISFRNGTEHRSPQYVIVTAQTVVAQVPLDMEPGDYTIVVRTSPNGKDVKETIRPGLVVT